MIHSEWLFKTKSTLEIGEMIGKKQEKCAFASE